MKNKDIKEFIDKTIYEETKKILTEQFLPNQQSDNAQGDEASIIDKFQSLSPLSNNVKHVEKITDGTMIIFDNVPHDTFIQAFNANSQEDAESKLIAAINNDLDNSEDGNYDVDVDVASNGQTMNIKITIFTGDPLGDDNEEENGTEMMENTTSIDNNNPTGKKTLRLTEEKLVDLIGKMVEKAQKENKRDAAHKLLQENTVVANGKKIARLTEAQMKFVLDGLVLEAIPGLEAVKTAHKKSKTETDDHMGDVEKKMKAHLSFEGNDNPEFPKQVNSGDKTAHRNSEQDEEFIDNYRGGTSLDLDYDTKPTKEFQERAKKAIKGDSKMGNSQEAANVIKSDLGEKLIKKTKNKEKTVSSDPMYKKDSQPIKADKTEIKNTALNESKLNTPLIAEEIQKMKHIAFFDKSSQ